MEGGGGAIDKKCCTKSRAVALGCKVNGNYADNQLIPQGSASKAFVSPKVNINISSDSPINVLYFIEIYEGSNVYLDTSDTGYSSGGGSTVLLDTYNIDDANAIGKSLSVSITFKKPNGVTILQGSYKWKLNGSNVPTTKIILHQGDVFDIIFTPIIL